jgi:hypothetical protein
VLRFFRKNIINDPEFLRDDGASALMVMGCITKLEKGSANDLIDLKILKGLVGTEKSA